MTTVALHNSAAPQSGDWLLACLEQVLKPIIRLFLARRVTYPAFAEVAKRIYIELAREDAARKNPRQPVSVSEIALSTGLGVKTITERNDQEKRSDGIKLPSLSPESAILEQWALNSTYRDIEKDKPLDLPIRGKGLSFATLVRRTQRNVSYGPVLDTLLDSGNIELVNGGQAVRLCNRWYRTSTAKLKEMMETICRCLEHFLTTLNWNIECVDNNQTTFYQQQRYTRKLHPNQVGNYRDQCMNLLRRQTEESVELIEPLEDAIRTNEHRIAGVGYYYFEL